MFVGAVENPFSPPYDFRIDRLAKKIAAGAQFFQTQYCYDVERLTEFMRQARDRGLHEKAFILVGVGPLASARAAEWIRANELIQQIREIEGVSGVHVMAYRQEESVAEIIDASGVLGGRIPWYPGRAEYLRKQGESLAPAVGASS